MATITVQAVVINGKHRGRIIKVDDRGHLLDPAAPTEEEIRQFTALMKKLEAAVTRFDKQLARTVAKLEARGLIHGEPH